jgi:hypothetical protein
VSRRDTRRRRRAASDLVAHFSGLGDDPFGELELFVRAQTLTELDAVLRSEVQTEVASILDAVAGFDAFDVIELMRLREFPISPVLAIETGHDGNAAALEVVALVLLTRDGRNGSHAEAEKHPHEIIDELHHRATRLTRLSSFWALASARLRGDTPLARIAATYQSYFVGVRRLQYDSVEDAHDEALFRTPEMDDLLRERLGFTYDEFVQVRDAVGAIYSSEVDRLRDSIADFTRTWRARSDQAPEAEIDKFRQAMIDMLFLPGQRAAFTAAAVAGDSGVSLSTADAVLRRFSIAFGSLGDPVDVVTAFLRGRNPLALTCLLMDGSDCVQISGPLGSDSFRSLVESATKRDSKSWERYLKARTTCSESLAVGALERLLGTRASRVNLKYWAPKPDSELESLGRDRADSVRRGVLTEADALFLVEDVAVCLEVKGRTIADAARRGDLARLETEIKNTIGSGAVQARRLESLIRINGGLWLEDGSWMDLSGVREVRSIVVGLDFFGPLSVGLGELQLADLLVDGSPPWVVSIHDLEVIARVLRRPSEFLLYLRRRTDSGVTQYFRGADELDLFMLFMDGGLYVAADPDEVRRAHPRTTAPSRRSKREHRRDARPTFVGTHTDPLDKWFYWTEGSSPFEADKPAFNAPAEILKIVDFLRAGTKPGWFRFGADLLGLSGEVQRSIVSSIDGLVDRTRTDHRFHTLVHGYAGMWGYPTFFVATFPKDMSAGEAGDRLYTYATAKKHQQRSDRSLGLLVDEHGIITAVLYLNDIPEDNEQLDETGRAIGLQELPGTRPRPTNTARRDKARRERERRTR